MRHRAASLACVAASLACLCVAPDVRAQTETAPAPAWVRCAALAGGVGAVAAVPGALPLWFGGAAKGMAVGQVAMDLVAQRRTPPEAPDTARVRGQLEREHPWFIAASAIAGSVLFTAALWPGHAAVVMGTVVLLALATDGFGTGVCRQAVTGARPVLARARTLGLATALSVAALLPLPAVVLSTVAGVGLIGISLGLLFAFPLVPGLGFTDLAAAYKRAGILQTASWVGCQAASVAGAIAVLVLLLEGVPAWLLPHPREATVEETPAGT